MVRTASPAQRRMETFALWALLAAGALIMIFPIYWMFATAIRPKDQIFQRQYRYPPNRSGLEKLCRCPRSYAVPALVLELDRNRGRGCGDHGQYQPSLWLCVRKISLRWARRIVPHRTQCIDNSRPGDYRSVVLCSVRSWASQFLLGRDPAACRRSFWHLHGAAVYGVDPGRVARSRAPRWRQ